MKSAFETVTIQLGTSKLLTGGIYEENLPAC